MVPKTPLQVSKCASAMSLPGAAALGARSQSTRGLPAPFIPTYIDLERHHHAMFILCDCLLAGQGGSNTLLPVYGKVALHPLGKRKNMRHHADVVLDFMSMSIVFVLYNALYGSSPVKPTRLELP
jgi:hypothetical protein